MIAATPAAKRSVKEEPPGGDPEDLSSRFAIWAVWAVHFDLSVDPSRAKDCRIDQIGPIIRQDDDHFVQ
jgi:hypothetical protein